MGKLSVEEAQEILQVSLFYDMPGVVGRSQFFALFKTYAIPSISGLLLKTRQLGSSEAVSKRMIDTGILIDTWLDCPLSGHLTLPVNEKSGKDELDPRAAIAVSRVNFIHSKYKISNDDFLYTLSLFVFEPIAWARRDGWRSLSPLECQAYYIYWAEIGRQMNIKDIPETLEELKQWSNKYEKDHALPDVLGRDLAQYTFNEMLNSTPSLFRNFSRGILICSLDETTRVAMMQPAQPWYLHVFTKILRCVSGVFQRYLCLPRYYPQTTVSLEKSATGFMHPLSWPTPTPWYKRQRTGLGVLVDRLAVLFGVYNNLPGPKYKSQGYRLEEVGPTHYEKLGHAEVMRNAEDILGCPITGAYALQGGH